MFWLQWMEETGSFEQSICRIVLKEKIQKLFLKKQSEIICVKRE